MISLFYYLLPFTNTNSSATGLERLQIGNCFNSWSPQSTSNCNCQSRLPVIGYNELHNSENVSCFLSSGYLTLSISKIRLSAAVDWSQRQHMPQPNILCLFLFFQTWGPAQFQLPFHVCQLTFSSCASATLTISTMTRRWSLCSLPPSTPSRRPSRWVSFHGSKTFLQKHFINACQARWKVYIWSKLYCLIKNLHIWLSVFFSNFMLFILQKNDDFEMTSFWLANTSRLLHCLKQYSGDEVTFFWIFVCIKTEIPKICF